jgi:hypothetical protein
LAIAATCSAADQDPISIEDLLLEEPPGQSSSDPSSGGEEASKVTAAQLVRTIQDARILYADRTRKIVYDCKLYSDDSRVLHGNYAEFYRDGRPFCRGQYRDGRRHGEWTFLRPDGTPAKEGEYVDDRPVGKWTYLRADGVVAREEMYKDGLAHGPWVTYGHDGKTIVSQIEFVDGKPVQGESG